MEDTKTMKPNKRVIKKWVEALRSGEYKQGRQALRCKGDRFCCLGVLCDLHSKAKRHKGWTDGMWYDSEGAMLPSSVSDWAGLDSDPLVTTKEGEENLSALNDTGVKFKKIATLIEREFLK